MIFDNSSPKGFSGQKIKNPQNHFCPPILDFFSQPLLIMQIYEQLEFHKLSITNYDQVFYVHAKFQVNR